MTGIPVKLREVEEVGSGGIKMKALVKPAKEFGAYPESCGEALNPLTQEKDVVILMFY